MTEELEEFVVKVRFPRHPYWNDEVVSRVKDHLVEAIDDVVRSYYRTDRWKTSVEEL